jgi:hypothetical protein
MVLLGVRGYLEKRYHVVGARVVASTVVPVGTKPYERVTSVCQIALKKSWIPTGSVYGRNNQATLSFDGRERISILKVHIFCPWRNETTL